MQSYFSTARYKKFNAKAHEERKKTANRVYALSLVLVYNLIGFGDIVSTHLAISSGNGFEANPLMRTVMEQGPVESLWIMVKLLLQVFVSLMIVYNPHKIVLGIFTLITGLFASIVYNNFIIAGIL